MSENIKVESISTTEYNIAVQVPANIVDQKFNEFFEKIKPQVEIPGFRKGKAPLNMLRKYFSDKAKAPVASVLLSEYYTQAIKDSNLAAIGQPTIKGFNKGDEFPGKFGFDNSYSVDLIVEVVPKIDPVGYIGLDVELAVVDENVLINNKMFAQREQFAEKRQVTDRGANLGDALVIDYAGFIDDVAFAGGSATGTVLNKLGKANFIPGFEEQLLGVKAGESKKLFVTFPAEYHAKHLAGKNATFNVTVHNITESKLAEENDDLALMSGFTSLEEMKNSIKADVETEKRALIRQKMDRSIIAKLLEVNKFDVPSKLVDAELQHILSRVKMQNISDDIRSELKKNAEFNVRRAVITEAIYQKETSLEVTPAELDKELEVQSKASGKTKDEVISALYNAKQMDQFVGIIRFAKVMDFIINNITKKEVE